MACKPISHHPNAGHRAGPLLNLASTSNAETAVLLETLQQSRESSGSSSDEGGVYEKNSVALDNGGTSSGFEFHKGDKKPPVGTAYLKLAPSKWDDAEKWLVNHQSFASDLGSKVKAKGGSTHGKHAVLTPTQQDWQSSKEELKSFSVALSHSAIVGHEHGDAHNFAFVPMPSSPPRAKSNDSFDFYPSINEPDVMKEVSMYHEGNDINVLLNPMLRTAKPTSDPASFSTPASALRSISMRDMGTEMTPIASQEPSQTGTPVQATTPTMCSPTSSSPSTPRRATPTSSPIQNSKTVTALEDNSREPASDLSEMPMQPHTSRETRPENVEEETCWVSKEDEETVASKLLKSIDLEEVKKNVLETRAAAWEEAEQAKYSARFKREEARIQAWENHAKAKAEAEMRRIEVKVERTRSHAHEKLMNKLAAVKRRAEERRAAAEAKRSEQAAKTMHQADQIRQTGRIPTPYFSCGFCHQ